ARVCAESRLHSLRQLAVGEVAGPVLVPAVAHADDGFGQVLPAEPDGAQHGACPSAGGSFGHDRTPPLGGPLPLLGHGTNCTAGPLQARVGCPCQTLPASTP